MAAAPVVFQSHWDAHPWSTPRLACYVVPDAPAFVSHVESIRRLLDGLPGLEPVAAGRIHLTLETFELPSGPITSLVDRLDAALAESVAVALTLRAPEVVDEGVVMSAQPTAAYVDLVDAVRRAAGLPATTRAPWPHLALAYASAPTPTAPASAALHGTAGVDLLIDHVSLVLLERKDRAYAWEVLARVPLSDPVD